MSIKLFNKSKGHTALCERTDWTQCRDHNPSKGWVIYTPSMEHTPERKNYLALIDEALDSHFTTDAISAADYAAIVDDTITNVEVVKADPFSEDYNERAAALREKNVAEIRTQGIGSNFMVFDPKDGIKGDNHIWFGTCNKCGETVHNNKNLGLWEHRVETINDDGTRIATYSSSCPVAGTSAEKKNGSTVNTDGLQVGDRLANVAGTVVEVVKTKGSHKREVVVEWQGEIKRIACSKTRTWVLFNR